MKVSQIIHPEDKEKSDQFFKNLAKNGFYEMYEGRIISKSGKVIWIQVNSTLMFLNGENVGSQDIIRDISERKRTELSLQKTTEELWKLNATKDKFFSIIAHDLRSPFSSMLIASDLLATNIQKYSKEKTEYLVFQLHSVIDNTYNLLVNLLEWANSQRGEMVYEPHSIQLIEFFNEKINLLEPIAQQKQISLKNSLNEDIAIYADVNMLSSILRNLMTNAIKFTLKGGHINLNAYNEGRKVIICVKDNGLGMTEKKIEVLFNPGTNETTLGTEKEIGTGLGLILCKEFVEIHGGRIWAESEIGKGSEFKFSMPFAVLDKV